MTITLLGNSGKANSTVAAPTSITPALTVASTAGNFLLLVVSVTGTSPTITTPANWSNPVAVGSSPTTLTDVFIYPNNPGGITSVAVTVGSTTAGGAVASIYEFSGVSSTLRSSSVTNLFTNNGVGTSGSIQTPNNFQTVDTLAVTVSGRVASTITPTFDSFYTWSTSVQGAVSTGATTNVQQDVYWTEILSSGPLPDFSATYGSSVNHEEIIILFSTLNSFKQNVTSVGGVIGTLVGQHYQGMIGG